ncbi:MAG: AlpA family transcriptional regulator [Xanthobacteraceae bacterium]|nr:AlpA family transcriptional regulator [Xanthobacteraceae bacterium]
MKCSAQGGPLDVFAKHNKNKIAFRSANQTAGFGKMVMVQLPPTQPAPQGGGFSPHRLLRLPEVLHRTGLSRSTVYRRMELGQFPKPYPLGGRIVAWAESEIDGWIAERLGG